MAKTCRWRTEPYARELPELGKFAVYDCAPYSGWVRTKRPKGGSFLWHVAAHGTRRSAIGVATSLAKAKREIEKTIGEPSSAKWRED